MDRTYILPNIDQLTDSLVGKCIEDSYIRIATINGRRKAFLKFDSSKKNDPELRKFKQYSEEGLQPIIDATNRADLKRFNKV